MKILFIVNEFPALSETFILNQITGLIDRGHEVDIYASGPRPENVIHPYIIKYRLLEKTYYYEATITENNWWASSERAIRIKRVLTSLPVLGRIILLHFKRSLPEESPSISGLFHEVLCLPRGSSYDIIQCHFGPNGNKALLLRDIGAVRGKIATAFHGFDISLCLRQKGDNLYRRLFDAGELFLPVSEYWKRILIELGCPKEKIIVHRMGVDCKKFRYTPRLLDSDGQIRLISIARLVEKKGLEYGIRAVARLIAEHINVRYTIIGDGPMMANLQKIIMDLGVGDNIVLGGVMKQDEIILLLERSHIMLAPSVTSANGDQEGIPVALIEAGAMGLPVISTLHSGIPELVRDGVSGFLVPEQDVTALYERLKYLVDHPSLWPDMGNNGRRMVETNHDVDKLNDGLLEIFLASMG